MEKVVILTGGSSGIGLETARFLQKNGCKVYEFSRRQVQHPEGIVHICVDVADESSVAKAAEQVLADAGRVDVLICNAGFGISGAAEFTDNAEAKQLLEVNLFGMVNAVKAVLPIMRRQGRGTILCISSVAAPIAIPFQAWYSVSKSAVRTYALALREELRPFGIHVTTVLPGDIRTGFTAAREKNHRGDDVYQGRISRSVAVMEKDEQTGMPPETAGRFIGRVALKSNPKPSYAIGLAYKGAVMLSRLMPERFVTWLVGMIYAR